MVGQLVTLISRRAFASHIRALSSRFSSRFVNNVVNFGARALPRLGARPIRIANSSCSVLRGASCLLLGRLSRGLAVFASRTVHRVFRVNRGELNRPIVDRQTATGPLFSNRPKLVQEEPAAVVVSRVCARNGRRA